MSLHEEAEAAVKTMSGVGVRAVRDSSWMDEADAGSALPSHIGAALDAFEADTVLTGRLGKHPVQTFVAMKRFEVERFTEEIEEFDVGVVTRGEIEEYAPHL